MGVRTLEYQVSVEAYLALAYNHLCPHWERVPHTIVILEVGGDVLSP